MLLRSNSRWALPEGWEGSSAHPLDSLSPFQQKHLTTFPLEVLCPLLLHPFLVTKHTSSHDGELGNHTTRTPSVPLFQPQIPLSSLSFSQTTLLKMKMCLSKAEVSAYAGNDSHSFHQHPVLPLYFRSFLSMHSFFSPLDTALVSQLVSDLCGFLHSSYVISLTWVSLSVTRVGHLRLYRKPKKAESWLLNFRS